MSRRALITGITGQDGSYLAELLLDKGYEVHGMVRRLSSENHHRLEAFRDRITIHTGDLLDQRSLGDVMRACEPEEIYNLAAMSFVGASWNQPTLTAEFTGLGVTRMLEAMREASPEARFYQASSSEMFGKVRETPQSELTPFYPAQPLRRRQGLRALHHGQLPRELRPLSPAPGSSSITRARAAASSSSPARSPTRPPRSNSAWPRSWRSATSTRAATGATRPISSTRCGACCSSDEPEDYVIGTGVDNSVGDLVNIAFGYLGLDPSEYVRQDPRVHAPGRGGPADRRPDQGHASSWAGSRRVDFEQLVKVMVDADLALLGEGSPVSTA